MSHYEAAAYHPKEDVVRTAFWIDDYFGRHCYGVRFDVDGEVYTPESTNIPLGVVFKRAE